MLSSQNQFILFLAIGILLNACTWKEASFPSPKQDKRAEPIPVLQGLALAITPEGDKMEADWQPKELPWSHSCREYAKNLDPCLVAWVDNEIKIQRPVPMGMQYQNTVLASYFLIRHEEGQVMHPEMMLTNLDLFDRRLWIETQDMRAIANNRVPKHALPLGEFGGIVPGDSLPNPMFRVGLSYNPECVQRRQAMNFELGKLRENSRVMRIVGRFVAVNPMQETLQTMKRVTTDMAKQDRSPWQQMKMSWHKPRGSMNWVSSEVVMLATEEWLTFRRPMDAYLNGRIDFKNHDGVPFHLGEWITQNNVAPAYMQGIFPSASNNKPGHIHFTIPTIQPRLDKMHGAIFVPIAVEIMVNVSHPEHGNTTAPIGCIPFEQKGVAGNLTRQLLQPLFEVGDLT